MTKPDDIILTVRIRSNLNWADALTLKEIKRIRLIDLRNGLQIGYTKDWAHRIVSVTAKRASKPRRRAK